MIRKIGVDLGNYNIKSSEAKMFESRMLEDFSIEPGTSTVIKYNKKQYLVEHGEFDINIRKVAKDDIMRNLATILAMSAEEAVVDVCVGLPVSHFESQKEDIIKHIKMNSDIEIELNGNHRKMLIRDIHVLPEAVGVYYSLSPDVLKALNNRDVLIVDIGGKTVDMCVIDKRKTIQDPMTEPIGMLDVYNEIARKVNSTNPEASLNLEEVRIALKEGLYLIDKKISLDFSDELFDKFVLKIFNRIKVTYKDYQRKIVIIAGGGSDLADKFKKHIPNLLVNHDIYANAKGFKKYLEIMELKRTKGGA